MIGPWPIINALTRPSRAALGRSAAHDRPVADHQRADPALARSARAFGGA
jgi:hypothetical protein